MKNQSNEYFEKLLKNNKNSKKQIAIYLDDETVDRIDMTNKIFAEVSGSRSFSRTTLIEEAINKFLNESEEYLLAEEGISVRGKLEKDNYKKNDVVIFSSVGDGFDDTFMGGKENPCWYPCNCNQARIKNLKYIAIYRGAPVSAITHYAKVKEFKYLEDKKYYVCYFDGKPFEFANEITLGSKPGCFFRGAKYTTIESLSNAKTADDIVFG